MLDLQHANILEWAKTYTGPQFHALLTDPPYHLTITKRFGKEGSAPAKPGKDGAFSRISKGFLGKEWDGGDIAFRPETWEALGEHLLPGAFGMAFASSKGWHRMAVAIEDAGFIIHPSMFGWVQGQGLPKATKVLDPNNPRTWNEAEKKWNLNPDPRFLNHRYGGQIKKPALEPIVVFQKPYRGKPQINILATGAGTLNIGAGRIPGPRWVWGKQTDIRGGRYDIARPSDGDVYAEDVESDPDGRWPANFYVDREAAKLLDHQSGVKSSGVMRAGTRRNAQAGYSGGWGSLATDKDTYADEGGLSRFFFNVRDKIDTNDPVFYAPKAKGSEKDAGLQHRSKKVVNDGRKKGIDNGFQRGETERYNTHPTVKPITLTTYLASLLLPPDEYAPRRLLVPFAGVGSEMIGGGKAGWEEVVGLELDEEYVGLGRDRILYWSDHEVPLEDDEPFETPNLF